MSLGCPGDSGETCLPYERIGGEVSWVGAGVQVLPLRI